MSVKRIDRIPILTYHSIDTSGSVVSTAPEVFRRQMKSLSESGYNVVALNNLVEVLANKQTYSPKTVALTFDLTIRLIRAVRSFPPRRKFFGGR